jgi:hypothetical protein
MHDPPSAKFTGDGHVVPESILLRLLVSETLEHSQSCDLVVRDLRGPDEVVQIGLHTDPVSAHSYLVTAHRASKRAGAEFPPSSPSIGKSGETPMRR